MKKYIYIVLTLCLLSSCEAIQRYRLGEAVAEVNGQKLHEADLLVQLQNCSTAADSNAMIDNYIRTWATEILVQEAAQNTSNKQQIERLVEDYRRALYVHEWEKILVEKRMNKHIPDSLILQFYEQFPNEFVLDESIIQGILLITPYDAPKQDSVRYWFSHFKEERLERIEKYAYSFGSGYELFLDSWKAENQILTRVPVSSNQWRQELKRNNSLYFTDSIYSYFVYVSDKHLNGERMPLDYAKKDIERTILQQRQVDFIRQEKSRLYEDALLRGKVIKKNAQE